MIVFRLRHYQAGFKFQGATWASLEINVERDHLSTESPTVSSEHQLVKFKMQTRLLSNSEQYFRGAADHSHGALTEMRAASGGLHTVPSTFHRSCARAVQEGAELLTEITHDGNLVRVRIGEEITHLGLVRHSPSLTR